VCAWYANVDYFKDESLSALKHLYILPKRNNNYIFKWTEASGRLKTQGRKKIKEQKEVPPI
jgi:hypothetical protein